MHPERLVVLVRSEAARSARNARSAFSSRPFGLLVRCAPLPPRSPLPRAMWERAERRFVRLGATLAPGSEALRPPRSWSESVLA
eukprot:261927-Prymnesium_polylepis.1